MPHVFLCSFIILTIRTFFIPRQLNFTGFSILETLNKVRVTVVKISTLNTSVLEVY